MKQKYSKTLAYLTRFEAQLRRRGSSSVQRLMATGAFYSMFAVGPYTFAPFKVVWRDMGNTIRTAVIEESEGDLVIPEHHVMMVPFERLDAAHYLAAVLASSPAKLLVASYTLTTGISTHVLEHLAIPRFDSSNDTHREFSALSRQAHEATRSADRAAVAEAEAAIDTAAASLWRIKSRELSAIQSALVEMGLGQNSG